jgi:histone-lysine N-methyltransferase SETD3
LPPGEPLYAWCGPQPNSRLLLNYGIVDESNPYDKLPINVTLPANDPLYKVKRGILQVRAQSDVVQLLYVTSRAKVSYPLYKVKHGVVQVRFNTAVWGLRVSVFFCIMMHVVQ